MFMEDSWNSKEPSTKGFASMRIPRRKIAFFVTFLVILLMIVGTRQYRDTSIDKLSHHVWTTLRYASKGNIEPLDVASINKEIANEEDKCESYPSSIEELPNTLEIWKRSINGGPCREKYDQFSLLYSIREKYTSLIISNTFMQRVQKWLNNNKELIQQTKKQQLIFVDNIYSQESVVFNPVRAKRPGASGGNSKAYVEQLVKTSSKDCDFCSYKKYAGQDVFGILESKHSAIVSNAFKIEKFHGMALFKQHNPIKFTMDEYLDQINLIGKWYKKVSKLAPDHHYRHMYRDVFAKASASQIHPHIHVTLANGKYYMKWNRLHLASLDFSKRNSRKNYWAELIKVHLALNLGAVYGNSVALAYVTPQKDYEVFVISPKPTIEFFKLVFCVVRAFVDDLQLYAISIGYVFPKLNVTEGSESEELPTIVRILSRGPVDSTRSDVSSFDLFGTPNVNKDPFDVAPVIRQSVKTRCSNTVTMEPWEWS